MAKASGGKSSARGSKRTSRSDTDLRTDDRSGGPRDEAEQHQDEARARGAKRRPPKAAAPKPAAPLRRSARPQGGGAAKRAQPRSRLARLWLLERRRRAEARERPGRPGRKALAGGSILVSMAALTLWLGGFADSAAAHASSSLQRALADAGFTLAHVEVRGVRNAQADEVAARLMLEPGELIFNFDPVAAKARVEELPWVGQAAVLRLLPDRVVVLVDERRPLARWRTEDGVVVLDASGEVIPGAAASAHGSLPLLAGDEAAAAAAGLAHALASYPVIARRAAAFERVGGRRWDMTTYTGVRVRLPEGSEAAALEALHALHESDHVLDLPLSVLDMRGRDLVMRPLSLSERRSERGA